MPSAQLGLSSFFKQLWQVVEVGVLKMLLLVNIKVSARPD